MLKMKSLNYEQKDYCTKYEDVHVIYNTNIGGIFKYDDVKVITAGQDVLDNFKAAVVWPWLDIQQVTEEWIQVDRLPRLSLVSLLECRAVSDEYWVHIWQ